MMMEDTERTYYDPETYRSAPVPVKVYVQPTRIDHIEPWDEHLTLVHWSWWDDGDVSVGFMKNADLAMLLFPVDATLWAACAR